MSEEKEAYTDGPKNDWKIIAIASLFFSTPMFIAGYTTAGFIYNTPETEKEEVVEPSRLELKIDKEGDRIIIQRDDKEYQELRWDKTLDKYVGY